MYPENTRGSAYLNLLQSTSPRVFKSRRGHQMYTQGQICVFYLFILLFTIVAFVSQIYVFMYPENTSGSPNVHAGTNLCIYLFILLFTIVAFILKFMPLCTLEIRRGHQMYMQGQICIYLFYCSL